MRDLQLLKTGWGAASKAVDIRVTSHTTGDQPAGASKCPFMHGSVGVHPFPGECLSSKSAHCQAVTSATIACDSACVHRQTVCVLCARRLLGIHGKVSICITYQHARVFLEQQHLNTPLLVIDTATSVLCIMAASVHWQSLHYQQQA